MPFLKEPATFKQQNLIIDIIGNAYDIIFCRNVMIYFNEGLKMKVLEKFFNAFKTMAY
jgi:chemotaxis protein methyltransferase CheR